MPALIPTDHICDITWLGFVPRRDGVVIETHAAPDGLEITWDGVAGAAHTGRTRPSDSRVLAQHDRGTEILNVRQITIVSAEDLGAIAAALHLDACDPAWLGANIVVKGLPDFTHIPPSSRLQAANGTTFVVDMENHPCHQIGKTIEADKPGHGIRFKEVAQGRRGVTVSVERPGRLARGDQLRLHIPAQRAWQPGTLGL